MLNLMWICPIFKCALFKPQKWNSETFSMSETLRNEEWIMSMMEVESSLNYFCGKDQFDFFSLHLI